MSRNRLALDPKTKARIVELHVRDRIHPGTLATRFGRKKETIARVLMEAGGLERKPGKGAWDGDGGGIAI